MTSSPVAALACSMSVRKDSICALTNDVFLEMVEVRWRWAGGTLLEQRALRATAKDLKGKEGNEKGEGVPLVQIVMRNEWMDES